jgi:hypothetical protein
LAEEAVALEALDAGTRIAALVVDASGVGMAPMFAHVALVHI